MWSNFWVVLCGVKGWTQWSLWAPSNFMILWTFSEVLSRFEDTQGVYIGVLHVAWLLYSFMLFFYLLLSSQKPNIIKQKTSFQKCQTTSWETVVFCTYSSYTHRFHLMGAEIQLQMLVLPQMTLTSVQYRSTYTHLYFSFFISPVFYVWHTS